MRLGAADGGKVYPAMNDARFQAQTEQCIGS